MKTISQSLSERSLGEPTLARNLAVFPLLDGPVSPLRYLTLTEALAGGLASVQEVSESGVVAELNFQNRSSKPILILDGEELVGAKQNRTVNVTILAPPGETLTIPVTCIEAGRWSSRSADFDVAQRAHFARGRAQKMASVSASLAAYESRDADQSAVWNAIAQKSARMSVHSPTSALSDVFESHGASVEDYVAKLVPEPRQTGAVFAIDGRVEGLELFDSPATFGKLFPMLVRSYALDALETADRPPSVPKREDAKEIIDQLASANITHYQALGLGQEVRVNSPTVIAGGLIVGDTVVHLAAFGKQPAVSASRFGNRQMMSARVRRAGWNHE